MDRKAAADYFCKLLGIETPQTRQEVDALSGHKRNDLLSMSHLFEHGRGLRDAPEISDTAWAAYNAVTEYYDHHKGRNATKRFESSIIGNGATQKTKALELLTA